MLDNFFRAVDTGDERIKIHGGASASETDAKENASRSKRNGSGAGGPRSRQEEMTMEANTQARFGVSGGGKPGVERRSIKIEASGGGFGNIALEIGLIFGIFGLFWSSFR